MKILKKILSYTTVILALLYEVFMFFNNTNDIYQYLILTLLILIATTSIINDIEYKDKYAKYFEKISTIVDKSSIQEYKNVDDCAKELKDMIHEGEHTVDFVSIDSEIRTKNAKRSEKMHDAVSYMFKSSRINLTYITMLRQNTIIPFVKNIVLGKLHNSNNSYAYYCNDVRNAFASFIVIDNRYVITRSPYEESQDSTYLIIRNEILAKHYKDWMSYIWNKAFKVENKKDVDDLKQRANHLITNDNRKQFEDLINSLKDKMEA